MTDVRPNRNLAYKIGLCRIAIVVDQLQRKVKGHRALAAIFRTSGGHGEQRARLTYFWWVVLGGNRLRDLDDDVITKDARECISPELVKDWVAVFREIALPIVGQEFTDAWVQRAERLARRLLITDEDQALKLAKAS